MATRINLLPWRAALRKQRTNRFYGMLGGAALVGLAVAFAGQTYYQGRIEYQQERNQLLEAEIEKLEKRIVKIKDLEETKERLIARMNVIQKLQRGRPQIVHLFEEFVTTLPSGLYLRSIAEKNDALTLGGIAESNGRVSTYMENLNASTWLSDPNLSVIEVREKGGVRVSDFQLTVQQTSPGTQSEDQNGGN